MKSSFFLIFFLNIAVYSYSQNSFELLVDEDNSQRPSGLLIDQNSDYLISSQEFVHLENTILYNSQLTKISPTGKVLNTLTFAQTDQRLVILDVICTENNEYITIGGVYADTYDKMEIWFVKTDSDFNILWETKILIGKQLQNAKARFMEDGNILIYGGVRIDQNYYQEAIFIADSNSGDLIMEKYYEQYIYPNPIFGLLKLSDNSGYLAFSFLTHKKLDADFEVITNNNNQNGQTKSSNILSLTNDTIFLKSILINQDGQKNIAVKILDTTLQQIHYYEAETETEDFLAFWDNLSFVNQSNIFLVGTLGMSIFPYETEPSWISVNNLNDTLGLNWQKTIGGDAYYVATNVLATEDGGCFIAATRSDNENEYDYDMYFVKLDAQGNITHINGETTETETNFLLYPNPASTQITIQKPTEIAVCQIQIYNMQGQVVAKQTLTQNHTPINTSNYPSGIYTYRIYGETKILQTGKFVVRN